MNRLLIASLVVLASLTVFTRSASAAPIAYQESVSGDLPATGAPLPTFTFDIGSNTISGNTSAAGFPLVSEIDSFAFIVPAGMEVTSATVSATVVTFPPVFANPDIVWFVRRGSANSSTGTFIESFIASTGASGGTHTTLSNVPLLPNTYNVTALDGLNAPTSTTYTFTFTVAAVPEPASLATLGLASLALLARRRKPRHAD